MTMTMDDDDDENDDDEDYDDEDDDDDYRSARNRKSAALKIDGTPALGFDWTH